jgi:hypothetical protein
MAVIAILAMGLVPGARAAGIGCAPPHVRLFAADAEAEVYITQEPYFEAEGKHAQLGTNTVFRGCVYGSRRSFPIGIVSVGSSSGEVSTNDVTLSGVDVGYDASVISGESGGLVRLETSDYVVVKDLRTGRVLHRVPDGIPLEARTGDVGVGSVKALAVKSDGAVAWMVLDDLRSEKLARETGEESIRYSDLYALDKTGERLLASGVELAPGSLALAGSTIYWTQGGRPFSALLH